MPSAAPVGGALCGVFLGSCGLQRQQAESRSLDLHRCSLEEDCLVCLAGNFKQARTTVETMGLFFPFYSSSFA